MPTSPYVKFKIENNNLEQTVPLTGVSAVLARTTKGLFMDPSTVISSPAQFANLFGSEIVPDGSPSNIEKALIGNSKLRVIRVVGYNATPGEMLIRVPTSPNVPAAPSKFENRIYRLVFTLNREDDKKPMVFRGFIKSSDGKYTGYTRTFVWGVPTEDNTIGPIGMMTNVPSSLDTIGRNIQTCAVHSTPQSTSTTVSLHLDIEFTTFNAPWSAEILDTQFLSQGEVGVVITNDTEYEDSSDIMTFNLKSGRSLSLGFHSKTYGEVIDGSSTFYVNFYKNNDTVYYRITSVHDNVLEEGPVFTYKAPSEDFDGVFDYYMFSQFLDNSKYITPYIHTNTILSVTDLTSFVNYLATNLDGVSLNSLLELGIDLDIIFGHTSFKDLTSDGLPNLVTQVGGSVGNNPSKAEWIAALEHLRDYTDVYQVFCSHLDQHLENTSDQLAVHKAAKELCDDTEDFTYYIEVPKYTTHYTQGTTIRTKDSIIQWVRNCIGTIGNSKWVAYFAGGIKYYNDNGILINSDILGTVIGLGDSSASTVGVWRSFAGMNRGVIWDGNGPCCPNYGTPSRYKDLNDLANNYTNIIIVKDTSSSGKQTMLWHCFTSQIKQDSFKFLSIVRLVLYMKKTFRPILESYIEEPNIWTTWSDIYLKAKPILDDLVTNNAISEYNWMGDQGASSYSDLVVNNEADVRQGKYKVILKFKDIVPMQEITITLSIDKNTQSSTAEISSN